MCSSTYRTIRKMYIYRIVEPEESGNVRFLGDFWRFEKVYKIIVLYTFIDKM